MNQREKTDKDYVHNPSTQMEELSTTNYNMLSFSYVRDTPENLRKIYCKLLDLFPYKEDQSFIQQLLMYPPFDITTLDEDSLFEAFLEEILNSNGEGKKKAYPTYLPAMCTTGVPKNIEDRCKYLENVLPDADPMYLYQIAAECDSFQALNRFIEENIDYHLYPTRTDGKERAISNKVKKSYIWDFDVGKFCKIFPDPFGYFEDSGRSGVFHEKILDFLKRSFDMLEENMIQDVYDSCKYNLTVTVKNLEAMFSDDESVKFVGIEWIICEDYYLQEETELPILQEVAFLKNKEKIRYYLEKMKQEQDLEYQECKEKGILLECPYCLETDLIPSNTISCIMGHVTCKTCLEIGAKSKISEGVYNIQCFTNCGHSFEIAELKEVLKQNDFEILLEKQQDSEISAANLKGLEYCGFCNVFGYIIPEEEKIFQCLNPECMKQTCRRCRLQNHLPEQCKKDKEAEKCRLIIEEKMTAGLVRICFACKKSYTKTDGCNYMTCTCGATMCYLCHKKTPIKREHFRDYRDYVSPMDTRCPLWTNDAQLEPQYVNQVAKETKEILQMENPGVDIDIDSLLAANGAAASNATRPDLVEEFMRIRSEATKKRV